MFQGGVGDEDGVVGLPHCCGDLQGWVHRELQLRFLAVLHRELLHEAGSEPQAHASSKAVEDQEPLGAYCTGQPFHKPYQQLSPHLLPSGVVALNTAVGSIFFATDGLLQVEEWAVYPSPGLSNGGGLQANKHRSGHTFP